MRQYERREAAYITSHCSLTHSHTAADTVLNSAGKQAACLAGEAVVHFRLTISHCDCLSTLDSPLATTGRVVDTRDRLVVFIVDCSTVAVLCRLALSLLVVVVAPLLHVRTFLATVPPYCRLTLPVNTRRHVLSEDVNRLSPTPPYLLRCLPPLSASAPPSSVWPPRVYRSGYDGHTVRYFCTVDRVTSGTEQSHCSVVQSQLHLVVGRTLTSHLTLSLRRLLVLHLCLAGYAALVFLVSTQLALPHMLVSHPAHSAPLVHLFAHLPSLLSANALRH